MSWDISPFKNGANHNGFSTNTDLQDQNAWRRQSLPEGRLMGLYEHVWDLYAESISNIQPFLYFRIDMLSTAQVAIVICYFGQDIEGNLVCASRSKWIHDFMGSSQPTQSATLM